MTIIIDATIIRGLLVPAMMAVAAEWTWWAPAPMQAVAKYLNIGDESTEPVNHGGDDYAHKAVSLSPEA
jgi:RND superfamily putative drug exporter